MRAFHEGNQTNCDISEPTNHCPPPIYYGLHERSVENDLRHETNDLRHTRKNCGMRAKPAKRRNVALLVESSRAYGRHLLRGIADFSRTRGNWALLHQEMTIDVQVPGWMRDSGIDGVIARVDSHNVKSLRRLNVPCVDVRCSRVHDGIPQVETDDRAVARIAFEHLRDRGFQRLAYCGFENAHFSENRLNAFRAAAADAHLPLSVYQTPGRINARTTSIEEIGAADSKALSSWLQSLEPPTGMLVCNDIRGQQVLNACNALNIAVPDDLGVLGVDDDDTVSPLCNPPLSSVQPNAQRAGYRAAEILDGMMNGVAPSSNIEYIAPVTVVQRMSTQVVAVEDREVARVCRFIREHACEGIDVNDVAQFTTLSRRQLERRFRAELNRTPHDEITLVQIDRVKQLLRESDLSLEQIAPLAGYTHKERLGAVFKRECGETPGTYRKRSAVR